MQGFAIKPRPEHEVTPARPEEQDIAGFFASGRRRGSRIVQDGPGATAFTEMQGIGFGAVHFRQQVTRVLTSGAL
jgi:hypothetical protein